MGTVTKPTREALQNAPNHCDEPDTVVNPPRCHPEVDIWCSHGQDDRKVRNSDDDEHFPMGADRAGK